MLASYVTDSSFLDPTPLHPYPRSDGSWLENTKQGRENRWLRRSHKGGVRAIDSPKGKLSRRCKPESVEESRCHPWRVSIPVADGIGALALYTHTIDEISPDRTQIGVILDTGFSHENEAPLYRLDKSRVTAKTVCMYEARRETSREAAEIEIQGPRAD